MNIKIIVLALLGLLLASIGIAGVEQDAYVGITVFGSGMLLISLMFALST